MIENILMYQVKVSIGSSIMFLCYYLFFNRDTFYKRNRLILALSMILPLVIPFIHIGPLFDNIGDMALDADNRSTSLIVVPSYYIESSISTAIDKFSFADGLFLIYISGLLFSIGYLSWGIYTVLKIIRSGRDTTINGSTIVISEGPTPPFSFLGKIVISEDVLKDEDYNSIINHELAHTRQKHYIDLMFCELFVSFQWFNPAAWLIRKAIKENHEFLADSDVADGCNDIKQYQLSLLGVNGLGKIYPLAHNFNKRIIKKRIIMMNRLKTNHFARLKNFLILPAIAFLLFTITTSSIATTNFLDEIIVPAVKDNTNADLAFQDPVKFSDASKSTIRAVIMQSIQYPREAALNNYEDSVYLLLTVKDGIVLKKEVLYSPKDINVPILDHIRIAAFKPDINPDQNSRRDKELRNLLKEASLESANKLKDIDIPEWKAKEVKFAVKLDFALFDRQAKEETFVVVQNMPTFNGGDVNFFRDWVQKQVKIPEGVDARGKVYIMFTVEKDGSVTDASIMRGLDPVLDKIAIDLVNSSPKWKPGYLNSDEPVKVKFSITVQFPESK
ncbi:MAG: energy transducer TonB [Bacteroidales bacterium]